MLKPKSVALRILLWRFYNNDLSRYNEVPRSGLNFLIDVEKKFDRKFLLLCGFEKFKNFYIRVDILEKLFLKIIENTKGGKFQISSEMMNLLGCSKENFFEIMYLMNYRKEKDKSDLFSYKGFKKNKNKVNFINKKDNPFKKLMSLNLK
jgi:ATP-dependent RNA helicase SUPV3L1/SUV3